MSLDESFADFFAQKDAKSKSHALMTASVRHQEEAWRKQNGNGYSFYDALDSYGPDFYRHLLWNTPTARCLWEDCTKCNPKPRT